MNQQKKNCLLLFVICLISRISFKLISGYDNYELFIDSHRYDILSSQILAGNFNMDIVAYLAAPLYNYTLAFFKLISLTHWQWMAVTYQLLLISLSAVYIYKIAKEMFSNDTQAFIAGLIYILYPLTMWYNFTLTQETTFQAYFIFFIFYFLKLCKEPRPKYYFLSTFFFAIALLTKSHILILIPFIFLILSLKKGLKQGLIFSFIVFLYTLPHGLYNKKTHGVYTFSSHGNAAFFLLGHSDQTYDCLTKRVGEMGDFSAFGCDPSMVFDKEYAFEYYGKINKFSVKERDILRRKMAIKWIKENPKKYINLKLIGLERFILPGLDRRQYKFNFWLLSFILGLLIYLPAYLILFRCLKEKWKDHLLITSIIIMTGAIFIIFFPVNRFRVITLEPFLMVYASVFYFRVIKKWLPKLIESHSYN